MTRLSRSFLFLSSYVPLFAIGLLLSTKDTGTATIVYAILLGGGLLAVVAVIALFEQRQAVDIEIRGLAPHGEGTAGYIASYLLPFVFSDFASWQDVVAVVAFIVLIGVVYVNSSMIHLNPTLALAGYTVYGIEFATLGAEPDASTRPALLIHRGRMPRRGDTIAARRLGDGMYLANQST
jgi:hypothetical protein